MLGYNIVELDENEYWNHIDVCYPDDDPMPEPIDIEAGDEIPKDITEIIAEQYKDYNEEEAVEEDNKKWWWAPIPGTKDWEEEDPVVISSEDEREAMAKDYYESKGVFDKWDPEFDKKT